MGKTEALPALQMLVNNQGAQDVSANVTEMAEDVIRAITLGRKWWV
jgi:hypothetical protein